MPTLTSCLLFFNLFTDYRLLQLEMPLVNKNGKEDK